MMVAKTLPGDPSRKVSMDEPFFGMGIPYGMPKYSKNVGNDNFRTNNR